LLRKTIMIKCGALAAVVIAGSAAGTATLVSNPPGMERVAGSEQTATSQMTAVRGARSSYETLDALTAPVADQPRRGERLEHRPASIAVVASPDDVIRRGLR
jgi:hypothetical protein